MDDELIFRSATSQTTAQEEERLAAWLAASSANAARAREVIDVLRLCSVAEDDLTFGPAPASDEILSQISSSNSALRTRTTAMRAALAAAAALVCILVGWSVVQQYVSEPDLVAPFGTPFSSAEFVTEREPATVGLRDGSVVRLGSGSRLRVHERQGAREVSLEGRGYFAVAHDDNAPFTIRTNAGTVTVLGTRFDLTITGDDLRLIVIEGRVRLTIRGFDVDVAAGQMAQVMKGNMVPPIEVPDPESLVDWVGNFVAFHNTPLRAVAREIESRHGVAMEFSDSALEDRTVTAFFAGRNVNEIAEVICVVTQLQCSMVGNVLTMSSGN